MPSNHKMIRPEWKCSAWITLIFFALAVPVLMPPPSWAAQAEAPLVALNKIPFQYKGYAVVLGQRFYRPGKERITAQGTLTYFDGDQEVNEPIQIIRQSHLKIRLDQGGKVSIFDGNNTRPVLSGTEKVKDSLQVLLEDSAEGFIDLLQTTVTRRHLGTGFKLESAVESDPGMDVILMSYPDAFQNNTPIQKAYWFSSRTKLLGVVSYLSGSGRVNHIVIDDYRDIEGEKLPFRVERWEDGKLVMRLTLNEATLSAGAEDGIFGGN
jgi:hypothetical protein